MSEESTLRRANLLLRFAERYHVKPTRLGGVNYYSIYGVVLGQDIYGRDYISKIEPWHDSNTMLAVFLTFKNDRQCNRVMHKLIDAGFSIPMNEGFRCIALFDPTDPKQAWRALDVCGALDPNSPAQGNDSLLYPWGKVLKRDDAADAGTAADDSHATADAAPIPTAGSAWPNDDAPADESPTP